MAIMTSPPWANWFLEIEDLKFPAGPEGCNNTASFFQGLEDVKEFLTSECEREPDDVGELFAAVGADITRPGVRAEIVFGDVLTRLTHVGTYTLEQALVMLDEATNAANKADNWARVAVLEALVICLQGKDGE